MRFVNPENHVTTNNQNPSALPMQIGTAPGEVSDLIEEIGHSGVANSPADVEKEGVLDRDHDAGSPDAPVPIVTSD